MDIDDIENIDCLSGSMGPTSQQVSCLNTIHHITGQVYLSGVKPINSQNIMERKIGLVICCADPDPEILLAHQQLLEQIPDISIVVIPYDDVDSQCLADNLPVSSNTDLSALGIHASDALTSALNLITNFQGGVLVHCHAGVSRSVAVLCYYLMFTQVISFDEALDIVQAIRPIADPNDGFREELTSLGEMIVLLS